MAIGSRVLTPDGDIGTITDVWAGSTCLVIFDETWDNATIGSTFGFWDLESLDD